MQTTCLGAMIGVLLSACSSSTPEAGSASAPTTHEPEPAEVAVTEEPAEPELEPEPEPEPEPAGPAPVLVEGDGDLDGEAGDEHLVLRRDGTLEAGDRRGHAEVWEIGEYWMRQASIRTLVFDRRGPTRALLVTLPIAEDEDPPNRYQLFLPDGEDGLRRILDITVGAYGDRPLTFSGDGTARYTEDGWSACDRVDHAGRARIQRVTLALEEGEMVERSRRNTGDVQRCDQLAACPYVYLVNDRGETELIGEILRNLRGSRAYAAQSLAVGSESDGPLRVRLSEEKPEVTHLDEIYLLIDEIRIPPRSCTGPSPRPAYCLADGEPFVLREGETLDLIFDASGPDAELRATGYYVPVR